MSESLTDKLGQHSATHLQRALDRLTQRLKQAETQAPPHIYQMLETLREEVAQNSHRARETLLEILKQVGASEEEFIDWLQLDLELLEKKFLGALRLAADPSKIDPRAWRSQKDNES